MSSQNPVDIYEAPLSPSAFPFVVDYRGHWKSPGYEGEAIVDPENKLVSYFKEKNMVHVMVSSRSYEFGMAQPAILAVRKDESVWEKWAIVPSVMNIGGAKNRPDLRQVWENIKAKLGDNEEVHDEFRTIGAWGVIKAAIFG